MCGRFAQVIKHDQLKKMLDELDIKNRDEQIEINFNLAPTQTVSAIISKDKQRILTHFRWGLIPSWQKQVDNKLQMINVRAETINEKQTFKRALVSRRCLIPASGFYEWRKSDKQPFFIFSKDELIYLAGIYEYWNGDDGSFIQSCAIITRSPDEMMKPIHDRMPVILTPQDFPTWLDDGYKDTLSLQDMLISDNTVALNMYPVSKYVNSIQNNSEECLLETKL